MTLFKLIVVLGFFFSFILDLGLSLFITVVLYLSLFLLELCLHLSTSLLNQHFNQ